jgi:photosystem II stability/assembly factor-like uncharacterized protein
MKHIIKILYLIILFCGVSLSQQNSWKHLGGPLGGTIHDFSINSKGEIFAGAYTNVMEPFYFRGLFKSTDQGQSWIKIESQYGDFDVIGIYISKEGHIWIGTNFQDRIYRSTDNGKTWDKKSNGINVGKIWAFGQSNDGVLFAGDGSYGHLYRSTDYGESWNEVAYLQAMVFATDKYNKVFAGVKGGLYFSTNNGINWIQDTVFKDTEVSAILIDSLNNIYVGTGYNYPGKGVYFSSNGGQNWAYLGLNGKKVRSLALDSKNNLYAGTINDAIMMTSDKGQTWVQLKNGIENIDIARIKIDKMDNIYASSEFYGFYRSTDKGNTFEQVGLPLSDVGKVDIWKDSLIFVSSASGLQLYNKNTLKWKNIKKSTTSFVGGLPYIKPFSLSPNGVLFTATNDTAEIHKSTDFGKTWTKTKRIGNINVINILAISDDTVFVLSNSFLYKTTNGGVSWSKLSVNTTSSCKGMFYSKPNIWVAGAYTLFRSSDGVNFQPSYSSFKLGAEVNSIYALPDGKVFAAFLGDGVVRSTNNGNNWNIVLPKKRISSVYADLNGYVFAGSANDSDTIWYSSNFGDSWKPIKISINNVSSFNYINKLDVNKLLIGVNCVGLFEFDTKSLLLVNTENNNLIGHYSLSQNYPNPFNPITTIRFTIPKSDRVQIKVYDMLGREIQTLVNDFKQSGNYEIFFDASNLPSGIYLYRMSSGDYSETKKMLLLK